MSALKKLVLECGVNSLDYLGDRNTSLVERIHCLRTKAAQHEGIELEIIPYVGTSGAHRGGRRVKSDNATLPELIDVLNSAGIPFIYVMNGGLLFEETVLPDESETGVLDFMSTSASRFGLKNKVVITRRALLPYLRQAYPVLEVVASCIQQTSPRESGPYDAKLQEYDYVVPLNQHTTYECLKGLAEHADRLIVFLLLTCGNIETKFCFSDYLAHEEVPWETILPQLATNVFDNLIPTGLTPEDSGCNSPRATLISREHDLSGLIGMGINKFKITRAQYIMPEDYLKLIGLIREYQPQGGCRKLS